jgi:hypothetical protein
MLPLNDYPHIRDTILSLAPYTSLLALRRACHDLRDRADAALLRHISLAPSADFRDLLCVRDGTHRLPRAGWLDTPLAAAVRVLDVHTPADAVSVRKAHEQMRYRAEEACWCGAAAARALLRLAPRLTGLTMVRRWGVHFCPTVVRAPRLVTFYPPRQPPYTYLVPAPVHVVHIALGGTWDPEVLVDAWETEPEPGDEPELRDEPVHFVFRFSGGRQVGAPDHRAEHAFTLLTDTVAGLVANGRRVTLVAPERWLPVWHRFPEWQTAQDIPCVRQAWAAEVAETVSFAEGTAGLGHDAAERLDRLFEILGEAEYRAKVGEEVYALERYSLP